MERVNWLPAVQFKSNSPTPFRAHQASALTGFVMCNTRGQLNIDYLGLQVKPLAFIFHESWNTSSEFPWTAKCCKNCFLNYILLLCSIAWPGMQVAINIWYITLHDSQVPLYKYPSAYLPGINSWAIQI